jgi:hypothetical protein
VDGLTRACEAGESASVQMIVATSLGIGGSDIRKTVCFDELLSETTLPELCTHEPTHTHINTHTHTPVHRYWPEQPIE